MQKAYEAGKDRFRRGRIYDWSIVPLFQRAKDIDQKVAPDFPLLRMVVNSPWRKAGAYVHGTARSITSRVNEENGGVVIRRVVRPEEQPAALYAANLICFALLSFIDLRLGKRKADKWKALYQRWAGVLPENPAGQ